MREVVIHVGLPKTGTSSIQETLSKPGNQDLLRRRSVLYPSVNFLIRGGGPRHQHSFLPALASKGCYKNHSLILEMSDGEMDAWLSQALESLADYAAGDFVRMALSSEFIYSLSKTELEAVRDIVLKNVNPDRIRIVVYVRNPPESFISHENSVIRDGYTRYEFSSY